MPSSLGNVDDFYSVKTRVMDTTRSRMAYLSHYLGYGWCSGCSSQSIGEGFIRNGDSWIADKNGPYCEGYKADHRLNMAYGNWSFGIKEIKFGEPITEEMYPETADSGIIYNHDNTEATETISRTETVKRTVTHVKTSSWKVGQELGLKFSYVGVGASYKFSYENSETTTDSTGKEQSKEFKVSTSKTLAPNSAASWKLVVLKTRKTIPYTATIIVRFSTELQGFLRWGGGYNGGSTNYHHEYRGSEKRPTFNYRFGNAETAFYTDLKRQNDTNSMPWMWTDMKAHYSDGQSRIDDLCNEYNYVFELRGQFQDVEGKQVDLHWDKAELVNHGKEH
uniref:Aerolysin-like C-terminal domain-containing protein n=1 Tax=Arion vulgaris TaxID=1028688 RepID=A0A0B7A872_9EUPU